MKYRFWINFLLLISLLFFTPGVQNTRAATTIIVTSTNDSGPGSLRQAIADASSGDYIIFNLYYPATIILTSGQLVIDKDLTIDGPGINNLTISGNGNSRVFYITSGINVTIKELTIANGRASGTGQDRNGGGIYNLGNLNLIRTTIANNQSAWDGGGIYNYDTGTLKIEKSTLIGNSAVYGGGIKNESAKASLVNSTLYNNIASARGGGIDSGSSSTLEVKNCTLYNNSLGNPSSTTTVVNTIITNSTGPACQGSIFQTESSNNLATDNTCSPGFTKVSLTDLRMTWQGWVAALQAGSAAIDAGNNDLCPNADQRAITRPKDGNLDGSADCDIGAYEFIIQNGWMKSNESGFGDSTNFGISVLSEFNGQMYAGTWGNATIWRTNNGQSWSYFTPSWSTSNGQVSSAITFGSHLYVGTANSSGGEIWRTDGTNWEQVAQGGLGDPNNISFYSFAVFKNALYTATGNYPPAYGGTGNGVEIWRSASGASGTWQQVNTDGFGAGPTWPDLTMDVFQDYLYVGISRVTPSNGVLAELWRSDNGSNWTPVFTDGLGDSGNSHVSAMAEFKGKFYISLRNPAGGQVWRSDNGLVWTPVFTDGLGNPKNTRPYGLIVHEDRLVLIFSITSTGSEVWQTADGVSWQQISFEGWGNLNNGMADYFDKAAVVFQNSLYIGTVNLVDGGEIWQRLKSLYLPLVSKNQ